VRRTEFPNLLSFPIFEKFCIFRASVGDQPPSNPKMHCSCTGAVGGLSRLSVSGRPGVPDARKSRGKGTQNFGNQRRRNWMDKRRWTPRNCYLGVMALIWSMHLHAIATHKQATNQTLSTWGLLAWFALERSGLHLSTFASLNRLYGRWYKIASRSGRSNFNALASPDAEN